MTCNNSNMKIFNTRYIENEAHLCNFSFWPGQSETRYENQRNSNKYSRPILHTKFQVNIIVSPLQLAVTFKLWRGSVELMYLRVIPPRFIHLWWAERKSEVKNNYSSQVETQMPKAEWSENYLITNMELRNSVVIPWTLLCRVLFRTHCIDTKIQIQHAGDAPSKAHTTKADDAKLKNPGDNNSSVYSYLTYLSSRVDRHRHGITNHYRRSKMNNNKINASRSIFIGQGLLQQTSFPREWSSERNKWSNGNNTKFI